MKISRVTVAALLLAMQMGAAAQTTADQAQGMGVVKTKDDQSRTVTIAHDPIAAFNWPAMTMKFKVADAALLQNIIAGDKVQFTLRGKDMDKTVVTAIKPVP